MFSETRYALNGDLRVAYRASREGSRDIVFVPNWFTNCEVMPELPSLQGWVEAITSLGRLIFFDQLGTGASDPVTPGRAADFGAMGRQHHRGARRPRESRSGSRRAELRVRARCAVRGDTSVAHHRAGRARRLRRCGRNRTTVRDDVHAAFVRMWGTGEISTSGQSGHAVERGDPGNMGSNGTSGGEPEDPRPHDASRDGTGRAGGPSDNPCADSRPPARR